MNVLIRTLPRNKTSTKILVGLACALNYAVYPALIVVFLSVTNDNTSLKESVALGFSLVAGKELFTFLIYALISSPRVLIRDIKHIFSKAGCVIAFGGLFGGPIGYSFQTIGAIYIGGALAAVLTSTSIIFIFIFETFFIKRRHSHLNVLGIIIAGLATVLIGIFSSHSSSWNEKTLLGILFALLASLSWACESSFMDLGIRMGKDKFTSASALRLRLFFSALVLLVIIWPIVALSLGQWNHASGYFSEFFTNWKRFLQIVAVGTFLFLARLFFLKAIEMQGATIGFIWYSLSSFITPFIILFLWAVNVTPYASDIDTLKSWWFWTFSIVMLGGIFLINLDKQTADKIFRKQINLKKIKNIIWNFDGVILESEEVHEKCWKEVLVKLAGNEITKNSKFDSFKSFSGRSGKDNALALKNSFNLEQSVEEIHTIKKELYLKYINESYLNQSALKLIKFNKDSGGRNFLATNSTTADYLCQKWGIEFDGYVLSNEIKNPKPDPEVFETCITKYELDPIETAIVEDSNNGLEACHALLKLYPIKVINYKNPKFPRPIDNIATLI